MDPNETMVENEVTEPAVDDTLSEGLVEEQDASESLDSVMTEEPKETAKDDAKQDQSTGEAGWIKKRVDKAVQKAVAETEARLQTMIEAAVAPYRERLIEQEARELVKQGEFKSLDRAKEYLQLKEGVTPKAAPEEEAEQPRNEKGQFAPKSDTDARAVWLAKQAQKIKASRGLDVMAEYNSNEETREKILSGEWDFYDVADELAQRKSAKPKAPSPMRSPNGASGSEKSSIASMTDAQFERLEQKIREGTRYNVR